MGKVEDKFLLGKELINDNISKKLQQNINNPRIHETSHDIKVASIEEIEKRRTQARKEQQLQEEQMWQQRDEGIDNAKRQEKRMIEDMIKNYSEENTYIMPQDMLSYFENILNRFGYGEQSPKEYDQEAKELKTAIEQIKQGEAKLEKMQNIGLKSEESKVDAKEPIKEEKHLQERNLFKNIYENVKAKVTSIFKKSKVQCFPVKDDKNKSNKFKESIGERVLTQKAQAQNARQYKEKQKYKTTNDRELDNINNTINNNYNIR